MNAITGSLCAFWSSSIGKKIVVAITGLAMVLFLLGHLSGNMLIFFGPEAFNEYAELLHSLGHGMAIWIVRIGLLAMITLHVVGTIGLVRQNKAARPKYQSEGTVQASKSSRLMIWSGLTVLAFIVFHILHFTTRSTDAQLLALANSGDPYAMVIAGFQAPLVSIFYIVALTCLCSHLGHGIGSIFQTLGIRTRKTRSLIDKGSTVMAFLIYIGFISIPLAILFGGVGCEHLQLALESIK